MKKVAEITNGSVSNLAKIEDDAPIPDGWVEAAADVRINDMYDGQSFATPAGPVIPFEDAKAEALAEVNATHASYLSVLLERATPEERDTWPAKGAAAAAFLTDTATDAQTTLIETEAVGGGITAEELAEKIAAKGTAFHGHIGQAGALRASGRAAVKAAATDDELQAALEAFRTEAQAAFDALAEG
ncbi:hypothetical protein RKLH11_1750 [Rhodobacteraceae bacterium KLH11]|nr:hypothetical protein RKLH11_1750 [Rhodobacteraceae bacterium KLH11]